MVSIFIHSIITQLSFLNPKNLMKSKFSFFLVALISVALLSCSEDEEKRKGDGDVTHTGEKWNVATIEYLLIDQSTSGTIGQTFANDTKANAGSFYFSTDANKGSFEISVEGYNKEDTFSYTRDGDNISIITVEQGVGAGINQNVIAISGTATETQMNLQGTILKQSNGGQFSMTVEILLEKE